MSEPTGLMAFWADFEPEAIRDIRRWHNCEHMLERVSIPGFQRGRRYRGSEGAATFLMFYETDDASVLASAPYRAALDAPTAWTQASLVHFRNPARNIYRLVAGQGVTPSSPAPFLATLRFNADLDDLPAVYRERVLPELVQRPDVIRARLWEIEADISGIQTKERKIYGGGPGEQAYVLFVDLLAESSPPTPAELPGLSEAERSAHRDLFPEIGWLDFALEAPNAG